MEHKTGKGQEVQASQHVGQALEITRQAAEASGPGEAAFNYPALGQEHEAAFGFRQLDDDQRDPVRTAGLGRGPPPPPLIDAPNRPLPPPPPPSSAALAGRPQARAASRWAPCATGCRCAPNTARR